MTLPYGPEWRDALAAMAEAWRKRRDARRQLAAKRREARAHGLAQRHADKVGRRALDDAAREYAVTGGEAHIGVDGKWRPIGQVPSYQDMARAEAELRAAMEASAARREERQRQGKRP